MKFFPGLSSRGHILLQEAFSLSVGKGQLFVRMWSMAVSADAPTSGRKKHLMKGWLWSTGVWLWAWIWLSLTAAFLCLVFWVILKVHLS